MAGKRDRKGSGGIVIKREEIVEGGHHVGAWKVAYADFVTAMMAFFLLMWLLNATTEEQRKGLADYFSPSNLMSHASYGTGEPFGGHTAFDKGAMVSDRGAVQITQGVRPLVERIRDGSDPVTADNARTTVGDGVGMGLIIESQDGENVSAAKPAGQTGQPPASASSPASDAGKAAMLGRDGEVDLSHMTPVEQEVERERLEKAAFEQAAQQIRDAVRSDPALADLVKQLAIDMTPEGLRIQIMDEVKLPMFPSGSAEPNDRVRLLMQKIVPVLLSRASDWRILQTIDLKG
jgi:chemotaxis protein MotB